MTITKKEVKGFAKYWRFFVYFGTVVMGIGLFGLILNKDADNLIFFGLGICSLGFAPLSISMASESTRIAKESKAISEKSNEIAEDSKIIAQQSKDRMDTIGDAEIQQSIINIEGIRKEYFYGIQEYLNTPLANRTAINIGYLQQINIFTTWLNYQNIQKALIYKDYMSDTRRLRLFGLHRLLMGNILPNWEHQIVSNESIHQLLMRINILYEHLEDNDNFHEQFYEVLNEYVGWIESDEEFLEYIVRINTELTARNLLNLFEPFQ